MKKFIKKYLKVGQYQAMFCAICFLSSCQLLEVEENFSIKNEGTSSFPKINVSFGTSIVFDLSSSDGAFVDLIFQTNQEFNGSVEIYATLNTNESSAVLVSTVEVIPSEIQLEIDEIKQAFQNADEVEDLEDGDVLFFTFQATINEESYQFNNTALSSAIICNSMISTANDTWTGNAFTDNGANFPATATAENITIIPLGGDNYLISDISAGWYDAINFRPIQEGIYNDECNEITWVGPGEFRQFDFQEPELEGTWEPQSQTLTVYWYDAGNDFSGQSIFTKN